MVLVPKNVQICKRSLGCQGVKHTCSQIFAPASGKATFSESRPVHMLEEEMKNKGSVWLPGTCRWLYTYATNCALRSVTKLTFAFVPYMPWLDGFLGHVCQVSEGLS